MTYAGLELCDGLYHIDNIYCKLDKLEDVIGRFPKGKHFTVSNEISENRGHHDPTSIYSAYNHLVDDVTVKRAE